MKGDRIQGSTKGYTLIELMVAIFILSFGLLGLAGLLGTAIKCNSLGNNISQATVMAQDSLEDMRSRSYADIAYDNFPKREDGVHGTIFSRSILIEEDTPLTELKRVTVTVSWQLRGQLRQVVLRTIFSDAGLP